MFKWLQRTFFFTRGERNALLVMSFLFVVGLGWLYWEYYITEPATYPIEENENFKREVQEFREYMDSLEEAETGKQQDKKFYERSPVETQDVGKEAEKVEQRLDEKDKICINRADSNRLMEVPGIGEAYSGRIVRYRDWLGGFYELEQLKEVYGMRDEHYEMMKDYLHIDKGVYETIDINEVSSWDLQTHPYIDEDLAQRIEAYRDEHGPFHSIDEIREVMEKGEWFKIQHYLEVK